MRQSFHTEESSVCVDYILDTEQEITGVELRYGKSSLLSNKHLLSATHARKHPHVFEVPTIYPL